MQKTSPTDVAEKVSRVPHLRWVPIKDMRILPIAQRGFNRSQAEEYAADFDLEALGYPVVNYRDGIFYILDGQHRVEALKLIGWSDQSIQCECYVDLTNEQMADLFLRRDTRRAIKAFDKFRIAITAGRPDECDIDRIVRAQGLRVSRDKTEGSVAAVTTLKSVYERAGAANLAQTLRIIKNAYSGDHQAFDVSIITGVSLVCQRYEGKFDEQALTERLSKVTGGLLGLLRKAQTTRLQTGATKAHCVAAAIVECFNATRGGKRLDNWWRET